MATDPTERMLRIVIGLTVLLCLGIVGWFVYKFTRQQPLVASVNATQPSTDTTPQKTTSQATQPVAIHPPKIPSDAAVQLTITTGGTRKNAFGFLVNHGQKRYLLCSASLLKQADWPTIKLVEATNKGIKLFSLSTPPSYVGEFTEEHQPNLLEKPDLSLDLAGWVLGPQQGINVGLPLSPNLPEPGETVWLIPPGATSSQWKRCKVVGATVRSLGVEAIDRFNLEDFEGCPMVNSQGEVVGNHLGNSAVVITGASCVALRNRLELWR